MIKRITKDIVSARAGQYELAKVRYGRLVDTHRMYITRRVLDQAKELLREMIRHYAFVLKHHTYLPAEIYTKQRLDQLHALLERLDPPPGGSLFYCNTVSVC